MLPNIEKFIEFLNYALTSNKSEAMTTSKSAWTKIKPRRMRESPQ
jgi:hypothetical protein